MKLLHIDSSILGANSVSRQIAAAAADRLRRIVADVEVIHRDLCASPLSHLTLSDLPADHPLSAMVPASETGSPGSVESQAVLDEFLAADTVLIAAPMYNFTIPSQLKAWFDRIVVPGKTFGYGPNGVEGLVDKRVILVISRGNFYGPGSTAAPSEHAEAYLRAMLGFIGIKNPEVIVAEGIQLSAEQRHAAVDRALQTATNLQAV